VQTSATEEGGTFALSIVGVSTKVTEVAARGSACEPLFEAAGDPKRELDRPVI